MSIATAEGILTLVVGVPVLIVALALLVRQVYRFHNPVTAVQTLSVALLLIHTIVYGFVFLNNDMPALGLGPSIIDTETTKIITRTIELADAVVVGSVVIWLLLPGMVAALRERRAGQEGRKL